MKPIFCIICSFLLCGGGNNNYAWCKDEGVSTGQVLTYQKNLSDHLSINTVYLVRDKVDLHGETLRLPPNCTLYFEGGAIMNGKIVYNNTLIEGRYYFDCDCSGTIANDIITPHMYGAKGDGKTDDSKAIQNAITSSKQVLFRRATYFIESPIVFEGQNYLVDFNLSTIKKVNKKGINYKYKAIDYNNIPAVLIIKPYESNTSGHITIKNLIINSDHSNDGIRADWVRNLVIENVRIATTHFGLVCNGFTNSFRDITIWDSNKGFVVSGGNAVLFERCFATGCGWDVSNAGAITLNVCSSDDYNPCYRFDNSRIVMTGCTFESMGLGIDSNNSVVDMTGVYEMHVYDRTKNICYITASGHSLVRCNSSSFVFDNYLNKPHPSGPLFISKDNSQIIIDGYVDDKLKMSVKKESRGIVTFHGENI